MSGVWACKSHVDPLIRTRARCSEPGSPNPHVGLLIRTRACCSEPGSPNPHVNPLIRTWAAPPTLQLAGLRAI